IGAGPADAGIAVNGNVSKMAVGRNSEFMAIDADCGAQQSLARGQVHQQSGVLALIGNYQEARGARRWLCCATARLRKQGCAQESKKNEQRNGYSLRAFHRNLGGQVRMPRNSGLRIVAREKPASPHFFFAGRRKRRTRGRETRTKPGEYRLFACKGLPSRGTGSERGENTIYCGTSSYAALYVGAPAYNIR